MIDAIFGVAIAGRKSIRSPEQSRICFQKTYHQRGSLAGAPRGFVSIMSLI
jgi:hypothetical protein